MIRKAALVLLALLVIPGLLAGCKRGDPDHAALAHVRAITANKEGAVEAAPCVVGNRVYVGSADGFLYALDAQSGALQWKYETGDRILGGANWAQDRKGEGHRILVGSYDGGLHCVDAGTGKGIWVYQTGRYINGTPALDTTGGTVMF